MPCEIFDGMVLCHRGPRAKRCACGHLSGKLCDAPVGAGKTCDAPLCSHCTTHIEPDTDYCPRHKHLARAQQQELAGVSP